MADANTAYAVVDMSKKEKRSSLKIPEKEITESAKTGSDEDIPPPIPDRLQADYSMITLDSMYSTGNQLSRMPMETIMGTTEKIAGNSPPVRDKLVPASNAGIYSMVTLNNLDPTASPAQPESDSIHSKEERKDPRSKCASSKIVACIFIAMAAAVTLIALASIVYLYVEVANLKLKTQTAPPQYGPDLQNYTVEKSIQEINSSIHTYLMMFSEEFTAVRDGTQLLVDNLGLAKSFPAYSCATLPPFSASGYYWVRASDGSPVFVYCDMTRSCGGVIGGWMRVAYLDMTNSSHQCPSGLKVEMSTFNPVRTCVRNESAGGCSSVLFATHNIRYSEICGRIGAYRHRLIGGFKNVSDINKTYVDGVSLTHGNPRHHIWTFAAALNEDNNGSCSCNHSNPEGESPPEVVGNDYFCDSGRRGANIVSLWQG